MNSQGKYVITEFEDATNGSINLDGLMIQISEDKEGHYDLVQFEPDVFWADKEKVMESQITERIKREVEAEINKRSVDKIYEDSKQTMEDQLQKNAGSNDEPEQDLKSWSLRDKFHGDGVVTKTITTKTSGRSKRVDKLTWCEQELGDKYSIIMTSEVQNNQP